MDRRAFDSYMTLFESDVIEVGIKRGLFSRQEFVPMRDGRLSRTMFGRVLGTRVRSSHPFAVDYYGLMKKSTGLLAQVGMATGVQVKMVETVVVHFASVRIESIAFLAPKLVQDFPIFKQLVLQWRRFPKNGRVKRNHS